MVMINLPPHALPDAENGLADSLPLYHTAEVWYAAFVVDDDTCFLDAGVDLLEGPFDTENAARDWLAMHPRDHSRERITALLYPDNCRVCAVRVTPPMIDAYNDRRLAEVVARIEAAGVSTVPRLRRRVYYPPLTRRQQARFDELMRNREKGRKPDDRTTDAAD